LSLRPGAACSLSLVHTWTCGSGGRNHAALGDTLRTEEREREGGRERETYTKREKNEEHAHKDGDRMSGWTCGSGGRNHAALGGTLRTEERERDTHTGRRKKSRSNTWHLS